MTSRHRRHTDRFKTLRRRSSPPEGDVLSFAILGESANHTVPLHTTLVDDASPVEPMSVSDFLRQPSSPPEWSSTTSASLTDSEDFGGSEAEEGTYRPMAHRSTVAYDRDGGHVKPTRRRETSNSGSTFTQDPRLDEFMKSSSRLHEQVYRRIEALEGVVETLLEGYREVLGRVAELERRMGGRGEELNERLGSLHRAVRLGRMPGVERVYEEESKINEMTENESAQQMGERSRGRRHRGREKGL